VHKAPEKGMKLKKKFIGFEAPSEFIAEKE
jgi:hypothetical protein